MRGARRLTSRPRLLAAVGLVCAVGIAFGGWGLASGGSGGTGSTAGGYPTVRGLHGLVATTSATLTDELRSQELHVTDVACVVNGRSYDERPIVRCNVDFGDPHIEAYCTVIEGERLLTNQQDPAIPCGYDNAGFQIITYPDYLAHSGRHEH